MKKILFLFPCLITLFLTQLHNTAIAHESTTSHEIHFKPSLPDIDSIKDKIPQAYKNDVFTALFQSGVRAPELIQSIKNTPEKYQEGISFLLVNMPPHDLTQLTSKFLNENVTFAYKAYEKSPWKDNIPKDVFLNYILPYSSLNEKRDTWRKDFYHKFKKVIRKNKSIKSAALYLNKHAFPQLKVQYHATKRPKPDQSPYESISAGYASCTGLSILLVDVYRSVGIPSRVVGTPLWTDKSGNHTWVEIWDDGTWYHVGAAEPKDNYNEVWFTHRSEKADNTKPEHRIYATSFKKTDLTFPLVWEPSIEYIHAINVTESYAKP